MTLMPKLFDPPPTLSTVALDSTVFNPMTDCALYVLKHYFEPGLPVFDRVPLEPIDVGDFLLLRPDMPMGDWEGDPRGFLDNARFSVAILTADPDGEARGQWIGEAVRANLYRAQEGRGLKIPDYGYVRRVEIEHTAIRKPDWEDSAGPVQYADLPTGYWRHVLRFNMTVRVNRPVRAR